MPRRVRSIHAAIALAVATASAGAQPDPESLQRQAIERIDRYVDRFRRTGDLQSLAPELQRARAELIDSNDAFRARGDVAALALGLVKLGKVERMQGQWDSAIARYDEAERVALQASRPEHQVAALTGRAVAESSKHDFGAAISHAAKAVQVAQPLGDAAALFDALDALEQAHVGSGNLAAAADVADRALAAAGNDQARLYYAHVDRADVHLKTAEKCDYMRSFAACDAALDRADAEYRTAVDLANKLGFAGLANLARQFLAEVGQRRQLVASQRRFAGAIDEASMFHPKRASDVLVTEHFVSKGNGLPPGLLQMYREAKSRMGAFGSVAGGRDHYVEGIIQQENGDHDAALASFLAAVADLERDRSSLSDETTRRSFVGDKIGFYYAAVLQLLEHGRTAEAFELMEESRSRAMSDLLARRKVALSRPSEQKLYADLIELNARIARSQNELFTLSADAAAEGREERRAELSGRIRALEGDRDRLVARISAEAPRLRELVVAQPVSLERLQQTMRAERFDLLEYLVLEHGVILWHVSADAVHARNVFLPRAQLSAKVAALQNTLEDRNSTFDSQTARELFLFLVQPALSWIRGDRVVIVPHEDLNRVPFQVFVRPDGRFLGEEHRISYAPSATVLQGMSRPAALRQGRLFAAADPQIDAAAIEVLSIAKRFGAQKKLIVDRLASKAEVQRLVGGRDVVHLSVHGYYDATEPFLSYLALGRAGGDDGKLTAAEMFGLPLDNARLVVLSACESGKAEATHGNEIVGMMRALLYARAGALVLSYWKVDSEATALWMETFYAALAKSPPSDAARAALRRVKAQRGFDHPYYWGAFMVVGR